MGSPLLGCYAAYIESYRRLGTTYQSHIHWQLDPWRWDRWVAPKRRSSNYQYTLRNISERRKSQIRLVIKCYYGYQGGMNAGDCIIPRSLMWVEVKGYTGTKRSFRSSNSDHLVHKPSTSSAVDKVITSEYAWQGTVHSNRLEERSINAHERYTTRHVPAMLTAVWIQLYT